MNQSIPLCWLASRFTVGCFLGVQFLTPLLLDPVSAQIIPDKTLPVNSLVSPGCSICTIEGGTIQGKNLFHSFQEFSLATGSEAFFKNDSTIENIFTRVTGNAASYINGLIRTSGKANLFLINPNGIFFGKDARLDVGGSFIGSTANSIVFSDNITFSTIPNQNTPLLSVNVPIGLQYGVSPAAIQVQQANLEVKPGQILALVGGDLSIESSQLKAFGGNVELGSLSGAGRVNLNGLEAFSFPVAVERGDISIDGSFVDVMASGKGNISINARNLEMVNTQLQAGIREQHGHPGAVAGDIQINLTGNTLLTQSSEIINELQNNSTGTGGNINLKTENLTVEDSQISVQTSSSGNAGNLNVKATQLNVASSQSQTISSVSSVRQLLSPTTDQKIGLFSFVFKQATGNGGDVSIEAKDVNLNGKSLVASDTAGAGSGGITTIKTERLSLNNQATISASTGGSGNAGELRIEATESIEVGNASEGRSAGLATIAKFGATGSGGHMTIKTQRLSLQGGGILSADSFGDGNGGSITIEATDRVELSGMNGTGIPSGIFAAIRGGKGNGGSLSIETGRLILQNGGVIDVGTEGAGNGGSIAIHATELVELSRTTDSGFSRIIAQTNETATGRGGDIFIETSRLTVNNGNQISAATFGMGEGGSLFVRAKDLIELSGTSEIDNTRFGIQPLITDSSGKKFPSGLFASSPGYGNADTLTIETGQLIVRDEAQVSASSQQKGAAGNLNILADKIYLDNGILSAETVEGERANIFLASSNILLRHGSRITTNATQDATGGNININTDTLVAAENSDITANSQASFGGKVIVNAQGIIGSKFREQLTPENDITATSSLGYEFSGVVDINTLAIDPNSGLIQLPANFTEASHQITTQCTAQKGNYFAIVGRGGLPQSPNEPFTGTTTLVDLVELISASEKKQVSESPASTTNNANPEIVEAQGWVVDGKGQVTLVSQIASEPVFPQMNCRSL